MTKKRAIELEFNGIAMIGFWETSITNLIIQHKNSECKMEDYNG